MRRNYVLEDGKCILSSDEIQWINTVKAFENNISWDSEPFLKWDEITKGDLKWANQVLNEEKRVGKWFTFEPELIETASLVIEDYERRKIINRKRRMRENRLSKMSEQQRNDLIWSEKVFEKLKQSK
jgi:hypothetical protein